MNDLLQMSAARQRANVVRANPLLRIPVDQHAQQLSDLIHVVARLPFGNRAREDVARRCHGVHCVGGDPAFIALLPDDAEVAELEMRAVAHEHVDGREIAVQHLPTVQLPEHVENPGNLASHGALGPALLGAMQVCAEVSMPRVLECEVIQDLPIRPHQRKRVEHADCARMTIEELPEVRLAQPSVNPWTHLDADGLGNVRRISDALCQIRLAEPPSPIRRSVRY